MNILKLVLTPVLGITLLTAPMGAQVGPAHFNDANTLITDLLSNSQNVNVYDGDGSLTDQIDWTGNPRTAITVCGTFITMLLKHTYGFTNSQFTAKTGSTSPNAAKYYDAIKAGSGFTNLTAVDAMVPGDLISIKYPSGSNASGHVMMVQSVGDYKQRVSSTQDFLANGGAPEVAGFYDVTVIDSSATYHGKLDTRYTKPGGIGRNGVFRIYVDAGSNITGYTWSTFNNSEYKKVSSNFLVAMGRLNNAAW
jgi:hypothetical protein